MDTAPLPASVSYYNELIALDPEAVDRAGQIEWTLRREILRNERDTRARIAFTQALLHQGKAAEAVEQVERVWDLREQLDAQELATFAGHLLDLGLYEQSVELLALHETPGSYAEEIRVVAAFSMGDIVGFARLATPPQQLIVERMRVGGLDGLFRQHQDAVRDALKCRQVATELILVPSDEEEGPTPTLCQMLYLDGSYAERREFGDQLYDRLAPIYEAAGKDVADAWELYTPMFMDFRGRTPVRPK